MILMIWTSPADSFMSSNLLYTDSECLRSTIGSRNPTQKSLKKSSLLSNSIENGKLAMPRRCFPPTCACGRKEGSSWGTHREFIHESSGNCTFSISLWAGEMKIDTPSNRHSIQTCRRTTITAARGGDGVACLSVREMGCKSHAEWILTEGNEAVSPITITTACMLQQYLRSFLNSDYELLRAGREVAVCQCDSCRKWPLKAVICINWLLNPDVRRGMSMRAPTCVVEVCFASISNVVIINTGQTVT